METGGNKGKIRRIIANTDQQLTVRQFATDIVSGDTYSIVPYSKTINGLCTPCHDPHGVSPTLGDDRRYAVPLLKGTWLTSPYKEDSPADDPTGTCARSNVSWGSFECDPTAAVLDASIHYQIDRNAFDGGRISEDDEIFAGLCLKCHPKENLTDEYVKNTDFRTTDRIHESVQGWGENTEHAWPCAKCHQAHNSGLPRLMQTNCLDYEHRGQRPSGGVPWSSFQQEPEFAYDEAYTFRGYPIGNVMGNSPNYKAQESCHSQAAPNPAVWPKSNRWNNVTPWTD